MAAIERFRDQHYYLSNMYPVKEGIETPEGFIAPTVEHLYQAYKFDDPYLRYPILNAEDGYKAKHIAKVLERTGYEITPGWEYRKVDVMRDLQYQKFTRSRKLGNRLIATGDIEIVEGNTWEDRFWGVSPIASDNGLNWLGRIIMETRDQLRTIRLSENL
jgi:ribA/ribD-fused uncharacterized protein